MHMKTTFVAGHNMALVKKEEHGNQNLTDLTQIIKY